MSSAFTNGRSVSASDTVVYDAVYREKQSVFPGKVLMALPFSRLAAYDEVRREQARLAEEAANARVAAERLRSEITTQQLSAEVVRAYARFAKH